MSENFATRKFNDGIEYVKKTMTPAMRMQYENIDYRITLQKMTDVEDKLVKGEHVSKADVDEILARLNGLLEVCNWAVDPPSDEQLRKTLQKLNPMRRMLINARNHATQIRDMIESDISEKFILNGKEYTLKEEHRFVEK